MSTDDTDGRSDQDVAARLDALRPVGPSAPRGGAARVRGRARRRQLARAGGLAAVVAALVTLVPVAVGGGLTTAPPAVTPSPTVSAPTVPAPTASATAAPSAEPTSPAAPEPTAVPEPSVASEPSPAPSAPGAPTVLAVRPTDQEPAAAGVLAGFDRPGRDTSGEGAFGGGTTWTFDPCGPTAWPGDVQREGWWSWNTFLGDSGADFDVAVYATEAQAADALAGFSRAAEACWDAPGDPDGSQVWQEYPPSSADRAVFSGAVRHLSPGPAAAEDVSFQSATWVAAVQQGRVVALVQRLDDFGGGVAAVAQGDLRPGAGGSFYAEGQGLTQADAGAAVEEAVDVAREEAARLATEVTGYLGED